MKFGKTFRELRQEEWADEYMDYKALKKELKLLTRLDEHEASSIFFLRLEVQINKVSGFMFNQQDALRKKVPADVLQLHGGAAGAATPESGIVVPWKGMRRRKLEQHFEQLLLQIGKFQRYVELNTIGFEKILKKFDKKFGTNHRSDSAVIVSPRLPCSPKQVAHSLLAPAYNSLQVLRQLDARGARSSQQLRFWAEELQAGFQWGHLERASTRARSVPWFTMFSGMTPLVHHGVRIKNTFIDIQEGENVTIRRACSLSNLQVREHERASAETEAALGHASCDQQKGAKGGGKAQDTNQWRQAKARVHKVHVDKAPVGPVPISKAPAGKAPVGEPPAGKAPAGKAHSRKAAVGKAAVGKGSVSNAPLVQARSLGKAQARTADAGKLLAFETSRIPLAADAVDARSVIQVTNQCRLHVEAYTGAATEGRALVSTDDCSAGSESPVSGGCHHGHTASQAWSPMTPPSRTTSRWWMERGDACPVSGFPINMLPYPPFKFTTGSRQRVLIDGLYVVLQVIADWKFEVLGRVLTTNDAKDLDVYMAQCKLGPFRIERALQLFEDGGEGHVELQLLQNRARDKLAKIRQIQRARLSHKVQPTPTGAAIKGPAEGCQGVGAPARGKGWPIRSPKGRGGTYA